MKFLLTETFLSEYTHKKKTGSKVTIHEQDKEVLNNTQKSVPVYCPIQNEYVYKIRTNPNEAVG